MLIMMIIIDDLHDYFNLDNYHDCWLIGDHMMMNMVRDYDHADWFSLFVTDWLWLETRLMIYWW